MIEPFASEALAGKVLLVTGASSGIGRASAVMASRCGARVILLGRSADRLATASAELTGTGHTMHSIELSNTDEVVERLRNICVSEGPIAGLLHAAGIGMVRPVRMTKSEQLGQVLAASLGGTFALARAITSRGAMHADGGSIVLMSSVAGSRGQSGMSAYSASKGAIDAAVRSLSCELAPRRIRVNSIVAGAVRTEMHDRTTSAMPAESVSEYEEKHLLGFGDPLDVAHVAIFLLSDATRWVTGACWAVDGGYLAR